MAIARIKQAIRLCRDVGITPFLWGDQGIGKSSLVRQLVDELAAEDGEPYGFIDFRCSQIEGTDLRGLPDRKTLSIVRDGKKIEMDATEYLPPSELPQSGKGILFLDEVNRAEDDVIQAAFQLVLDRKLGRYTLPEGWSVVCAGNYAEKFNVNNFDDKAWLDRFCHIELTVSDDYLDEWADYMHAHGGDSANRILQFISTNNDHLFGADESEHAKTVGLGFSILPSPRSWQFVMRIEQHKEKYHQEVVFDVTRGIIGMEMASSFRNFSCNVTPDDVLAKGDKIDISKLDRGEIVGVTWGLAAKTKAIGEKIEDKQADNVMNFMVKLAKSSKYKDLSVALGTKLIKQESDIGAACLTNPTLADILKKVKATKKGGWIERFHKSKEIADLMSRVGWGKDED